MGVSNFPREMLFDKNLNQEQINLLISQYNRFLEISKLNITNNQLEIENKEIVFQTGTLLYLCDFSSLMQILEKGIIANEFIGKKASDSNYYCKLFYRIKKKISLNKYNSLFLSNKLNKSYDLAVVINPISKIGSLLYYDLFDIKHDSKENIRNIIDIDNTNSLYITTNREEASCVLCGIPTNCISGFLLCDRIVLDEEKVKEIKRMFPNAFLSTMDGKIIKDRSNTIKIDDYDEVSLKYCMSSVENEILKKNIKKINDKYKKLKDSIEIYMESVKEVISPLEQAKLFLKMGYKDIPKSVKNLLTKEEIEKLSNYK